MKIVVTGGSGFIGSHLMKHLKTKGQKVYNYDLEEENDLTSLSPISAAFRQSYSPNYSRLDLDDNYIMMGK